MMEQKENKVNSRWSFCSTRGMARPARFSGQSARALRSLVDQEQLDSLVSSA
jgi:hypothetical protein